MNKITTEQSEMVYKEPNQVNKPVKKRKWLKRTILGLFTTFILLIVLVAVLLYTRLGVQVVNYVLDKWVDSIKIEKIDGTLNDLSLTGFTFETDGVYVGLQQASLKFDPICLLTLNFCVKELTGDQVTVKVVTQPTQEEEVKKSDNSKITLPVNIELDALNVTNIHVDINGTVIDVPKANGHADWFGELLTVYNLQLNDSTIYVPETQEGDAEEKHTVSSQSTPATQTSTNKPTIDIQKQIDDLFGHPLLADLAAVPIPLDIDVKSLSIQNTDIDLLGNQFNVPTLNLVGNLIGEDVDVIDLNAQLRHVDYDVNAQLKGAIKLAEQWPLDVKLIGSILDKQSEQKQEIDLTLNGSIVGELYSQLSVTGKNDLNLNASVDLSKPYLPVEVNLASEHIQWPLFTESEYEANQLNLMVKGNVQTFNLSSSAELMAKEDELAKLNYQTQISGSDQSININELSLNLLDGMINANAGLSWKDDISWRGHLLFEDFDLTKFVPDYPIELQGEFNSTGYLNPTQLDDWQLEINKTLVKGKINRKPFNLTGSLTAEPTKIESEQFAFDWGNNHITLKGSTENHFIANLNLSELNVIVPELSGKIVGESIATGSSDHFELKTKLVGDQIKYEDTKLNKIIITNDLTYQNELFAGDLNVDANHLSVADTVIDGIKVGLKGDEKTHHFTVDVKSSLVNSKVVLDGSLNDDRQNWIGNIQTVGIDSPEYGVWKTPKPVLVNYNIKESSVMLTDFCLMNKETGLCLNGPAVIGEEGDIDITIHNVELNQFLHSDAYQFAGKIDAVANLMWDDKKMVPTVKSTIKGTGVKITEMISGNNKSVVVSQLELVSDINSNRADVDMNIQFDGLGGITGKVMVTEPMDKKNLSGEIKISPISLEIVNRLLGDQDAAQGNLTGNIKVAGTLQAPKLLGAIELTVDKVNTQEIKTNIEKITLTMNFNGDHSNLSGLIKTAKGGIDITGNANWRVLDKWTSEIAIKGEELRVEIPELVYLYVAPNIKIQASAEELNVTGRVQIPKAKITVKSMPPSVVDVSSDEVMLDKNLKPIETPEPAMIINAKVLVSLGDDVTIDAYGLKANLDGHLYIEQSPKGMTGAGTINIPKGRFHAYGQDLVINKGEIIFAGPLNNPRLNIEAIRNPESIEGNVQAGLRITGLADKPEVAIFSNPAMSQQEALSYILRGQGLDAGSQSENDLLTAALIGLGTAESGRFLGGVGEMFGIKDLELDTTGVGNSQKVVVSGNLTPDLQLKYSMGIFDALATFTVRYRLLPKLYMEASSGVDQTIDLIYQFER